MQKIIRWLPYVVGLALLAPATAAAQSKKPSTQDRCIASTGGNQPYYVITFQDVPALTPQRTIPVRGVFYPNSTNGAIPFDGSAVMALDGSVRVGVFVHGIPVFPFTWTMSAVTDTSFAGTYRFDTDGDFYADPGSGLAFYAADCTTVPLPQ